jgi:hypothetical protein
MDADTLLACPIQARIEEVMVVQTLAFPGDTPRQLMYQGDVLGQRPIQIAISPSSHIRLRCS